MQGGAEHRHGQGRRESYALASGRSGTGPEQCGAEPNSVEVSARVQPVSVDIGRSTYEERYPSIVMVAGATSRTPTSLPQLQEIPLPASGDFRLGGAFVVRG